MTNSRWFVNPGFDLSFFHLPVWFCWVLVFFLPDAIIHQALPTWVWVSVVLVIDVGHVWSSIYRTYLDPVTKRHWHHHLRWVPVGCLAICFALALHSDLTFWRVMAYVAAFHFVKQQVGVAALYRARQLQCLGKPGPLPAKVKRNLARLDKMAVYAGTLGPLVWWHLNLPRTISWFIQGDFVSLAWLNGFLAQFPFLKVTAGTLFFGCWVGIFPLWLGYHFWVRRTYGVPLQTGKLLWVLGTGFNWYLGLVHFDSDLVFTLTNVVAHGVPYYGLIALHGFRRLAHEKQDDPTVVTTGIAPLIIGFVFFLPILGLALTEEFFWDFLIYRDHPAFFQAFFLYPADPIAAPVWRAGFMALLALPQVVHYVLDGFIWKMNGRNPDLKTYLMPEPASASVVPRFGSKVADS